MNKPAPKEPSMDEILSSIRQIIADDDASAAARRQPEPPTEPPLPTEPAPPLAAMADPPPEPVMTGGDEPLALSADQMLAVLDAADDPVVSAFAEAVSDDEPAMPIEEALTSEMLVDPEDVTFELEPEPLPPPAPAYVPPAPVFRAPRPVPEMPPPAPVPAFRIPEPSRAPRQTAAQAAPMPDPTLSEDIAEQLLAPAADAAVRANFARLGGFALGTPGMTIEGMMRDMLRPMLKEWLDENLPAVVERMVEKEIARISRGTE